jgi:hypothetical protein
VPHGGQVAAAGAAPLGRLRQPGLVEVVRPPPLPRGLQCRRCGLRRLRLGLLPGRQLSYIRVVGLLPGGPRLCLQLLVFQLRPLPLLPVAVNPCLEMVMEQSARLPVAAVPQHPKPLHLGHGTGRLTALRASIKTTLVDPVPQLRHRHDAVRPCELNHL